MLLPNLMQAAVKDVPVIANGEFESWGDGTPVGWDARGIKKSGDYSHNGLCVVFPPAAQKGATTSISRNLTGLKSETTYRIDYHVRRVGGGSLVFRITGCDGKGLRFSGNGGYFSNLAYYRYTRYFTTGKNVDSENAKITFTGAGIALDSVSISTLKGGFNGIEMSPPDKNGMLKFICGLSNPTDKAHSFDMKAGAVNFLTNTWLKKMKK